MKDVWRSFQSKMARVSQKVEEAIQDLKSGSRCQPNFFPQHIEISSTFVSTTESLGEESGVV